MTVFKRQIDETIDKQSNLQYYLLVISIGFNENKSNRTNISNMQLTRFFLAKFLVISRSKIYMYEYDISMLSEVRLK